jgi:hypothetical protein
MNKLKIKEFWEVKIEVKIDFQYIFLPLMKGEIEVKGFNKIL